MEFEVYCDEAHPDLFTSQNPKAQYLMIGSLWLPASLREEVKSKVKALRHEHNAWGEIKWTKVSPSQLPFYLELIEMFISARDFDESVIEIRCNRQLEAVRSKSVQDAGNIVEQSPGGRGRKMFVNGCKTLFVIVDVFQNTRDNSLPAFTFNLFAGGQIVLAIVGK